MFQLLQVPVSYCFLVEAYLMPPSGTAISISLLELYISKSKLLLYSPSQTNSPH